MLGLITAVVLWVPYASAAPENNADHFVVHLYYETMAEVQQIADGGYDIWANERSARYLVVAVNQQQYQQLTAAGWELTIDVERTAALQMIPDTSGRQSTFFGGYRTVDELYSDLATINAAHPTLTELVDYGDSYCKLQAGCTTLGGDEQAGYDLYAIRVSNEAISGTSTIADGVITQGSKPVFFLMANIHSREITTPELAMNMLDWLLDGYGQNADATWLVDWHEVWIIPTANPDGHWLVELGTKPPYNSIPFYHRKNANRVGCDQWPPQSSYHYGVDLNRNHSFGWGGSGTSADPCSAIYRGPAAASEPEVVALQNLITAVIPDQRGPELSDAAPEDTSGLFITLHSYGDLVLWPWGNTTTAAPNKAGLQAIGDHLASFNGYTSCQPSYCLYSASGTSDDWAYGVLGVPAFTFEVGNQFMPSFSQVAGEQWPKNGPALHYAARIARAPYTEVFGPDVVSLAVTSTSPMVTVTAVVDDIQSGDRPISSTVFAVDTPYWADGIEMTASPVDGVFDEPQETVTIALPTAVYGLGRHIIFVRAQDTDGYWGPTHAIFVDLTEEMAQHAFIPVVHN